MRCLFIGLDAFDPEVLREGVRRGDFPALARLKSRSRLFETTTDPGTYVGSLWVTVHTGVDPSQHGLYCWADLEPGTYRVRLSDERHIPVNSFWTRISRAGHRCAIIDVPHCKLDQDINGLHVINWMTHFKTVEGFATTPPISPTILCAGSGGTRFLIAMPSTTARNRSPNLLRGCSRVLPGGPNSPGNRLQAALSIWWPSPMAKVIASATSAIIST